MITNKTKWENTFLEIVEEIGLDKITALNLYYYKWCGTTEYLM